MLMPLAATLASILPKHLLQVGLPMEERVTATSSQRLLPNTTTAAQVASCFSPRLAKLMPTQWMDLLWTQQMRQRYVFSHSPLSDERLTRTEQAVSATATSGGDASAPTASGAVVPASTQLPSGAIAGIVIGIVAILIFGIAAIALYIRGCNMAIQRREQFDMAYNDHRRMREEWHKALSENDKKSSAATLNSSNNSFIDDKAVEIGSSADGDNGHIAEMGSGMTWVPELPPHTPQELEAKSIAPPPRNPSRIYSQRTSRKSLSSEIPSPPPRSPKRTSTFRDPLNNWPAVPTRASLQFPKRAHTVSAGTDKELPASPVNRAFENGRDGLPPDSRSREHQRRMSQATTVGRPARDGSRSGSSTNTISPASRSSRSPRNRSRNDSRGSSSHRAVSPMEHSDSGSTSRMLLQSPSSVSSPSSRAHSRESHHTGRSASSTRTRPSPALSDFLNSVNQLSPVSLSPSNSLVDYRTRS